jgi:hypothetical protein
MQLADRTAINSYSFDDTPPVLIIHTMKKIVNIPNNTMRNHPCILEDIGDSMSNMLQPSEEHARVSMVTTYCSECPSRHTVPDTLTSSGLWVLWLFVAYQ